MKRDLMQGVKFSHLLFEEHIETGARVIDATAGNGYDTIFLAELVGERGQVLSFDIQHEAIMRTEKRLTERGLGKRVKLIQQGHEEIGKYLDSNIDGILFNLGYLPGGNREITTRAETTLRAVKTGQRYLKPGGLIVLVIYTEQPGGEGEKEALLKHAEGLNCQEYNVLHYHFLNQSKNPPQVLAIKKRSRN